MIASSRRVFLLGSAAAILSACATAAPPRHFERFVFSTECVYQPLLKGPPQTGGMRSGRVALKPGEEMHRHSTEGNEEMLVFLRGHGQVILNGTPVDVGEGEGLYIPPHTAHEVHNTGTDELRYVYTVAPSAR